MSWSYSGNPANSEVDRLRFLSGDTNAAEPILQDEEIQFLITEYGSNENALRYYLFVQVATVFARDIKRSLGPQSEDPTERLKFFKSQVDFYRSKLTVAGISIPTFAHPKVFRKGMQNNPPWPGGDGYV
jgi:tRNA nucleotidyltransferase (CCA-adding enzyme)